MLSSTLVCRLSCSFYSSPFIWVKLEQVASLYAFFANSILNFEAVQVLVISRRIFREDKFVILLRLEKFAVLRWREKLVQSPLTTTIWYADGILDSLIETGQYTVFLFRFVSAQSNQPKLIHGIGTEVHFEAKNLLLPQWESAGRASDVFGANCSNQITSGKLRTFWFGNMESGKKLYMDFKGAGGEFFEKMNLLPFWDLKNSPFWGGEKS